MDHANFALPTSVAEVYIVSMERFTGLLNNKQEPQMHDGVMRCVSQRYRCVSGWMRECDGFKVLKGASLKLLTRLKPTKQDRGAEG